MFRPKIPKREKPDKNDIIYHDIHGPDDEKRDWSNLTHITFIAIDPGIVNLGVRVVRRPYKCPVLKEEVKSFSNTSFKSYTTDPETGVLSLFRIMNQNLDKYRPIFPELNVVIVEGQLPLNYKMVRTSQHIISYFIDRLAQQPLYPLLMEVKPTFKTQGFNAPKGLNDKQVKDWSIEKALQLLFVRQDWNSFWAIVNSDKHKADDLADVVVYIEVICKKFGWGITPIPKEWDELPAFAAWQPGVIFFNHLCKMLNIYSQSSVALSTKQWLSLLQKQFISIQSLRNSLSIELINGGDFCQFKGNYQKVAPFSFNPILFNNINGNLSKSHNQHTPSNQNECNKNTSLKLIFNKSSNKDTESGKFINTNYGNQMGDDNSKNKLSFIFNKSLSISSQSANICNRMITKSTDSFEKDLSQSKNGQFEVAERQDCELNQKQTTSVKKLNFNITKTDRPTEEKPKGLVNLAAFTNESQIPPHIRAASKSLIRKELLRRPRRNFKRSGRNLPNGKLYGNDNIYSNGLDDDDTDHIMVIDDPSQITNLIDSSDSESSDNESSDSDYEPLDLDG